MCQVRSFLVVLFVFSLVAAFASAVGAEPHSIRPIPPHPPAAMPVLATHLAPTTPTASQTFNVTAYGARCDGSANDAPAIQAALNAASAYAAPQSGTAVGIVQLPTGTCLLGGSASLKYNDYTTLQGQGQGTTKLTNMTNRGGSNTIMLDPAKTHVEQFTVQQLTLDQRSDVYGFNGDQYLLSIDTTDNATIQDVTFSNVRVIAVWCDSGPTAPTTYATIQRSTVTNSLGDGFSVFGAFLHGTIVGNTIENTRDDAIALQDDVPVWGASAYPSVVLVQTNTIMNCYQRQRVSGNQYSTPNGINLYGADQVTVDQNRISYVFSDGLRLGDGNRRGTQYTATNNTIDHAGYTNNSAQTGVPPYGIAVLNSDTATGATSAGGPPSNVVTNTVYPLLIEGSTNVTGF